MPTTPPSADPRWDDLVDRLAVYDLHYLTGGSAWDGLISPYCTTVDAPVAALVVDLAYAPQARLRDALVALLFRHPEHAPAALQAAGRLPAACGERLRIHGSILAAAALRVEWSFVLGIYLPGQPAIEADRLAAEFGVPSPRLDYGRPCLAAVAERFRKGQPFPFAYERGWEDVAGHVMEELRLEARRRSA